jgi:DNA-binding transcriptional LysR family regulator
VYFQFGNNEEIRGFAAVADARSFSQAARRLGISAAQISKLVASLEDRLGVRLLNRTTRDVSLTDTGRSYLARARELLEAFDQLESSVDDTAGPRGLLRISVPVSFGALEIGPALLDFAAAHEEVGLDVSFSDRAVNLVEEGFDAVRVGGLADSSLVARRLASARIVTCASPAYLARHGTPLGPAGLAGREVIIDLNPKDPFAFDFGRGPSRQAVRVNGRLRFSSAQACLAAARAGLGIARAPAFAAVDDLRAGRLKSLLCEFEPEPLPIHVVYPQTRHLAAKVRAFVDFLAQRFAGEPEWHRGWN